MWQRRQSMCLICKNFKEIHAEGLGATIQYRRKYESLKK